MGTQGEEVVDTMACLMLLSAGAVFPAALLVKTPYGRYSRRGWGIMIDARLAWMELPSLVIPIILLLLRKKRAVAEDLSWPQLTVLGTFLAHYAWRSLVFPLLIRSGQPTPFSVWLLAFTFTTFNGFMQGYYCIHLYPRDQDFGITMAIGIILWAVGWGVNLHADGRLRQLRRKSGGGYHIPTGGMFEYISAANYFGEIVEWAGWALACSSLPAFAFAIMTFANLAPRGYHHHQYYKKNFPGYPSNRRAVIPFLW